MIAPLAERSGIDVPRIDVANRNCRRHRFPRQAAPIDFRIEQSRILVRDLHTSMSPSA